MIKERVAKFFEDLYSCERFLRPQLDGLAFLAISLDCRVWLERDFEEEEIALALSDCVGNKAPSLDGFIFSSIRVAWDFLNKRLL